MHVVTPPQQKRGRNQDSKARTDIKVREKAGAEMTATVRDRTDSAAAMSYVLFIAETVKKHQTQPFTTFTCYPLPIQGS